MAAGERWAALGPIGRLLVTFLVFAVFFGAPIVLIAAAVGVEPPLAALTVELLAVTVVIGVVQEIAVFGAALSPARIAAVGTALACIVYPGSVEKLVLGTSAVVLLVIAQTIGADADIRSRIWPTR